MKPDKGMVQRLLLEGNNDKYVISELCVAHLPPPKGYQGKAGFRDFIIQGNSVERLIGLIPVVLKISGLSNFGIVVDANSDIQTRFNAIKNKFEQNGITIPYDRIPGHGFTFVFKNIKIGIWIMPDNQHGGYLEHFVTQLIPKNDELLLYAMKVVEDLETEKKVKFRSVDKQKAIMHTWLAWQKKPGLPIGGAIKAKFLDSKSESVIPFISWMKSTFEF